MKSLLILSFLLFSHCVDAQDIYKTETGKVTFVSEAPKERIEASSTKVVGLLKVSTKSFAFSLPMSSFLGFNSELQREHFNENYVESNKYPKATFKGKITTPIDFKKPGSYSTTVKGKLNIHGVEMEEELKANVVVKNNSCQISSKFNILLDKYQIAIPDVVKTKLSNTINVSVEVGLVPKS